MRKDPYQQRARELCVAAGINRYYGANATSQTPFFFQGEFPNE